MSLSHTYIIITEYFIMIQYRISTILCIYAPELFP